jgi:hypothetical protein
VRHSRSVGPSDLQFGFCSPPPSEGVKKLVGGAGHQRLLQNESLPPECGSDTFRSLMWRRVIRPVAPDGLDSPSAHKPLKGLPVNREPFSEFFHNFSRTRLLTDGPSAQGKNRADPYRFAQCVSAFLNQPAWWYLIDSSNHRDTKTRTNTKKCSSPRWPLDQFDNCAKRNGQPLGAVVQLPT